MISIRQIEPRDDAAVERIIRDCLIEYSANRTGCAWDDDLSHFSSAYAAPDAAYWVAEDDGAVIAGAGIGGCAQHPRYGRVCELQKMYCIPASRGSGVARRLLDTVLSFAAARFDCVYLETFGHMAAARRFYAKNGFVNVNESLMATGHTACDVKMVLSPIFFMKTKRLGFARWKPSDGQLAHALWGDPMVTRRICASGVFSESDIQARLQFEMDCQRRHGVQYWPLYHLSSGELVGCCGLHPHGDGCYELGFHLRQTWWGQGFATEAAAAVIDYAFHALRADSLFAGHHPDNAASEAVLRRLGFEYTGRELYPPTGLYHPSYTLYPNDRRVTP